MLADLTVSEVIRRCSILGGVAECAGEEQGVVEVVESSVAGTRAFYESEGGLALNTSCGGVADLAVGHAADAASRTSIVVLA